jgi:hypothetical protein
MNNDLSLAGFSGRLVVDERHPLNTDYLRHHPEHFGRIDQLDGVGRPSGKSE